jgi:alpha 1,3-glucosidase
LQNADAPGHQFALTLTAYKDGFVKLLVDEAPGVGRYRISDITSPDVEERKAAWSKTSTDSKGAVYSIDGAQATVELKFNPFRLAINSHGKPAVVLNSRDMFNFEHRRKKEVCQCSNTGGKHGSEPSRFAIPEGAVLMLTHTGCRWEL